MLIHDAFSLACRRPAGAVPAGTVLHLRCFLAGEDPGLVYLYYRDTEENVHRIAGRREQDAVAFSVSCEKTGLIRYAFVSYVNGGYSLGPKGPGEGAEPTDFFTATVYDPAFTTPAWFRDSVCYQIFPDRFFRSAAYPTEEAAEVHRFRKRNVYLHESWAEEPAYLPQNGAEEYAPEDYFGGNLKGIAEKLPYLKSLGIGSIYLNPIFEADSNHRYNTADYRQIDPLLGTEADWLVLAKKARECGIRLILDGVFSHTGADSRYFDKKGTYGNGAYMRKDSPYASWYRFHRWPDDYECWWNFVSLPNVEETAESYADFIHGERGVLSYWMQRGASGWRLDVADELPESCIRSLRKRVKAENPEGLLIGEVWEDCSDKMGPEGRRTYVDGAELDGAMNYPFRTAVLGYLSGQTDAYACENALLSLYAHYPRPFYEACLNLLSSHDEVRALSYLSGAPSRFEASREEQAAFVPAAEAEARGKRLFLAAVALQMSVPGVPCVYYGDEAGLTGLGDPFNRRSYPWGREDTALQETVRKLIALRNTLKPLKKEGFCRIGALSAGVLAVIRYTEEETALLLVNRGARAETVCLYPALLSRGTDANKPVPFAGEYADVFTKERLRVRSTLTVTMAPESFRLLIRKH